MPNVMIFALLYGDHIDLHSRLLDSFKKYVPKRDDVRVMLWGNELAKASTLLVADSHYGCQLNKTNVPKYHAMRTLFNTIQQRGRDEDWVVWFDDDSYITAPDWYERTMKFISDNPEVRYFGQPWFVHHLPGQWEFIQQAEWYKGKDTEMLPTKRPGVKKPGITFAQGAYWWARVDALRAVNWPDPRLAHNGGDTLLGEAMRQHGWRVTKYYHGVAVNKAKRRGRSDKPAGSAIDTRR